MEKIKYLIDTIDLLLKGEAYISTSNGEKKKVKRLRKGIELVLVIEYDDGSHEITDINELPNIVRKIVETSKVSEEE